MIRKINNQVPLRSEVGFTNAIEHPRSLLTPRYSHSKIQVHRHPTSVPHNVPDDGLRHPLHLRVLCLEHDQDTQDLLVVSRPLLHEPPVFVCPALREVDVRCRLSVGVGVHGWLLVGRMDGAVIRDCEC